jgi:hypothetical protein
MSNYPRCKAIRRSGDKKGEVCNNEIFDRQDLCLGHMTRLSKAVNEGEKEEKKMQGIGRFAEKDTLAQRLKDSFMQLNPWE